MTWLDGALATTLQRAGLPPFTPVDDWILERPDEVRAVHRAFAEAGAEIVLAGTFRALPHLTTRWAEVLDRAVALARVGPPVWLSLGPASTPSRSWRDHPDRPLLAASWAEAAQRGVFTGAEGIVLETFLDPEEALAAVGAVRPALPSTPLVVSLSPAADGRLADGSEPAPWLARLGSEGASGAGFNCGTGPASIRAAVDRCGAVPIPLWARPSRGEADDETLLETLAHLATRCRWVGGCCGVGPETIAAAVRYSARRGPGGG